MRKLPGSATRVASPWKAWAPRFAFIFLVAVAMALMVMGRLNSSWIEQARVAITDMTAPLLDLATRPVDTVGDVITTAEELANLRTENEYLKQQNERLMQWQSAAQKLESENATLRDLLNMVPEPGVRFISARAVGDPGGAFVRSIIVNAGQQQGVAKGQAAVTGDGLAGRVAEVGNRSARVLLLTDMNSRVPVLVGKRRDRAILGGDNTQLPQLHYIGKGPREVVASGDFVVTSGQGGVFPPDIPVGRIVASDDGIIRVRPMVDWNHLEFVRLVDYELPSLLADPVAPSVAGGPR